MQVNPDIQQTFGSMDFLQACNPHRSGWQSFFVKEADLTDVASFLTKNGVDFAQLGRVGHTCIDVTQTKIEGVGILVEMGTKDGESSESQKSKDATGAFSCFVIKLNQRESSMTTGQ